MAKTNEKLILILKAMFEEIDEIFSKTDVEWTVGKYSREEIARILWPGDFE